MSNMIAYDFVDSLRSPNRYKVIFHFLAITVYQDVANSTSIYSIFSHYFAIDACAFYAIQVIIFDA